MNELLSDSEYKNWLIELKTNIKRSQIKAALAVNSQLIQLYWDLGKQIVDKQAHTTWGSGFIDQLSKDLRDEFPEMGGFSRTNLFAVKKLYLFYNQPVTFIPQVGGQIENLQILTLCSQIPWKHNVLIIEKIKDISEALFYIKQTIENNWSRSVLEYQIEINLYQRQGKAITNFKHTLPEPESDLAQAILKDTYNFEFLTLSSKIKELDLEQKLIENIANFLLELGKGFAYMGRQFEINVGGEIFRTDLLFFHTKLKCYVVIELKVTKFKPEFVGKLNFYLTAIDRLVKDNSDKPTIGILLCKSKNDVVVDFALHDVNKPMGVSEFSYTQLPENIKNALPTIQQLTEQLDK
jgi:predicted nuclease of restriction endonuclease-like (RecB) superfamily